MHLLPELSPTALKHISSAFYHQLNQAHNHQSSSLSFLLHPIPTPLVPPPQSLQILTIGGTNVNSTQATISHHHLHLSSIHRHHLLPLHTATDFFRLISSHLHPQTRHLALNLAFPLRPVISTHQLLDGLLTTGVKEHQLRGLDQAPICQQLTQYLSKHHPPITATCANDIICLGLASLQPTTQASHIALVLGTGFNSALVSSESIINLESGNFSDFPFPSAFRHVDQQSHHPGAHLLEKATAGAYLHLHYNHLAPLHHLQPASVSSTQKLAHLATSSSSGQPLASAIFHHSAQLVAAHLHALITFVDHSPVPIAVEGSLFSQAPSYPDQVSIALAALGLSPDSYTFSSIKHSSILGAARLFNPGLSLAGSSSLLPLSPPSTQTPTAPSSES